MGGNTLPARCGGQAGGRPVPGQEPPISTSLALVAVLVLVALNGFFVATEFALVAVRRTRIQQLAADGSRRARSTLDLLDHLDTYIAATQLGITIASIGLGWIGEPALARLIEPAFDQLVFIPEGTRDTARHWVAFILAFSIITALHIVFGELAPKSLALQRPEATSLWAARPIHWFYLLFRPAIYVLNSIGNAVVRLFGISPAAGHTLVQSAEELKLAIDASREAGLVDQAAHDLVDRAFVFTELDVRQAMVPRTEMVAVPVGATLDEVLGVAMESGHLRLPVYEGDTDHIVGLVNVKRLLPQLRQELAAREAAEFGPAANGAGPAPEPFALPEPFDLRALITEPLAVPETVPAPEVLRRLRESPTHMAVVIDEYGGTAGIVTLVDLVESLVGEIGDELDPAPEPDAASDGSFALDGLTTLVEAKEFHDLDLEGDGLDVETVGGFVFGSLGRPAKVGDEVTTRDRRVLRVEELDGLRVARVRVLPPPDPTAPDSDAQPTRADTEKGLAVRTLAATGADRER